VVVVIVVRGNSEEEPAAAESPWGAPTTAQDDGEANPVPTVPTVGGGEDVEEQPDANEPAQPSAPPAAETPTGDLSLGVPMTSPACDGGWVVFLGAATEPATYAEDVRVLLARRSDAKYTLTQGGCSSMRQQLPDGTLIYAVWTGPYPDQATACAARTQAGDGAYVKRMDNVTPADQLWQC
jgi:serine/threonine-protein kinase